MQGTAAAYDLARLGDADEVRLLDIDMRAAQAAADRVNALLGRGVAKAGVVNASDKSSASQVLEGMHACLSAVPYFLNLDLSRAAIDAGCHFNDLGGNTQVVLQQLGLDKEAKAAKVSVVPDCGVAPGMANTLAVYGMRALDRAEHVHLRCGGLPQNRDLPLGYRTLFSMEGLTNEYFGKAVILREGRVQEVDTFEELETLELPAPLGEVEAFITSGGTSTCPYTFEGQVQTYDYKTIRYPGHYEKMKLFKDLGFIDTDLVEVKGHALRPRDVFHALMSKVWNHPEEPDLLVLRVDVEGIKDGRRVRHRSLVLDKQDPKTGFSAMERTTAYPAAIVTALQAQGRVPPGAVPLEKAVDAEDFVRELGKRDIMLETSLSEL
ncbi:MAG: saccharopine dehydrogenase NADP-binding domain-containing protein [Deltaproteobacteria bacterium]|nr:saccharopine dehydrogenase NADP-binding domain-containing protein [Deltaproteobacteria bacterium]